MRARGLYNRLGWGKHKKVVEPRAISARKRPGLKDERPSLTSKAKYRSGSDTTRARYENEERGCARADSEGL